MISKFFPTKFWVSSWWACAKKIYFGQPCAKVDLNPMPESTLSPVKSFGFVFWLPCPSFSPFCWRVTASRSKPTSYLCSLLISTQLIHSGSQKNDIFCTSIYCTILCVHCGVNCTIIRTHRVICHLQKRANTEAEFLDEKRKSSQKSYEFSSLLFTITFTALLEISISSNHATSYNFCKGERRKIW